MERIDNIIRDRIEIENNYKRILKNVESIEFQKNDLPKRDEITWLICVLYGEKRDDLIGKLKNAGIDARPFFYPLSSMPLYKKYVFSCHNSQQISPAGLLLPTNNKVTETVLKKVRNIFQAI